MLKGYNFLLFFVVVLFCFFVYPIDMPVLMLDITHKLFN